MSSQRIFIHELFQRFRPDPTGVMQAEMFKMTYPASSYTQQPINGEQVYNTSFFDPHAPLTEQRVREIVREEVNTVRFAHSLEPTAEEMRWFNKRHK